MISLYTAPDSTLLARSHRSLWCCGYQAESELRVIRAKSILSVVAMVPHRDDHFFVVEKLGLEVAYMGGIEEDMAGDEE